MATAISHSNYIKKCIEKHGNAYSYDKTKYSNRRSKILITCKEHGDFEQEAGSHLYTGSGCPKCGLKKISDKVKLTTIEFINKAKKIHGTTYDYSNANYLNTKEPIIIICFKHGEFKQKPNYHLSGNGCQKCFKSKGEKKIYDFLKRNGFEFEEQKMFNDCKNINKLKYDFFIPKKRLLIEYDGQQHYKEIDLFTKKYSHSKTKKNDEIKNEYALRNGYKLVRIPYFDFNNIETILLKNL